jgi:hypothetical protein
MKRSLLLSKVRKSSDRKPAAAQRRRRPSRKLAASLDALAATLPELPADGGPAKPPAGGGGGSSAPGAGKAPGLTESLERKRGVTKRREKMVRAETQRFRKNLAILSLAGAETSTEGGAAKDGRWSALRKHLETTVGGNT